MRIGIGWNVGMGLVVFVAGAMGSLTAWAAEPPAKTAAKAVNSPSAGTLVTDDERNAEVRAKLAKRTNIEFIETPLNQVLDFLRDAAEVQIHLRTRALDEVGIGQDIPLTLNLQDVSVATALELMLDDLQLDYAVDRGLVIVSTPDDLQAKMVVRAYGLQPLLPDSAPEDIDRQAGRLAGILAAQVAPDTWGTVEVGPFPASVAAPAAGTMGGMGGMPGMGGGMPQGSGMTGGPPITVHLGGSGAISVFHRLLIIRNSIKVQDEVDRFLRMLGEAKAAAKQ